ncbi:MAG: DNA-3-methyladenine glycosylase I [Nitrospirota bacterium]|nr:DNA-3-methyladenine glycosylase I [Nitrospirota bacterium]
MTDHPHRCEWCLSTDTMTRYHDTEWGVPLHDDNKLFEFLILDCCQAGLSWSTILNKRENYRRALDGWDAQKIARYTDADAQRLLANPGIVRNRLKVAAKVTNARAYLAVQEEFGSFDSYIWRFVDGTPIVGRRKSMDDIPATTPESDALSRDLKKRGFKFVGSTIVYAFMQSVGMANDHTVDCFRYAELTGP